MGKIAYLDEFWRNVPPPPEKPTGPVLCPEAAEFQAWCQALLAEVGTHPTLATIHRAQHAVSARFFEWDRHVAVPAHHRAYPKQHRCVLAVWRETFETLRTAELRVAPLLHADPTPARPTSPTPFIAFGEDEDKE